LVKFKKIRQDNDWKNSINSEQVCTHVIDGYMFQIHASRARIMACFSMFEVWAVGAVAVAWTS
jgi:hypothetical protein